jgi:hypothetical protein
LTDDTIFNAIDNLIELTDYSLMPMSLNQAVSLVYIIFMKGLVILQDLRAWNQCPAEQLTYANMQIQLRAAQQDVLLLLVSIQM